MNMISALSRGRGSRRSATEDFRVNVGMCLRDTTPSRAGRIITKVPGTNAMVAVPRAYQGLCNFKTQVDETEIPSLHLVYFACAIKNVDTLQWIRHALRMSVQFDTVSIVFQCRGVMAESEAKKSIGELVSEIGRTGVTIYVYDDPPLRDGPDLIDHAGTICRVPISECVCHDNYGGEYRGIHMAHEIASKSRDGDVITYWHSKGVSRHKSLEEYLKAQEAEPTRPFMMFQDVRRLFASLPNLALWSCVVGDRDRPIPWFNFWSTRAHRLKSLSPPVRTGKRHYYETYLGDLPLKPHEITISPCPIVKDGFLHHILEVGFQASRPAWWNKPILPPSKLR